MTTLKTVDSSILSLIVLIIVYLNLHSRYERTLLQHKLFIYLIRTNMALIIIDLLGWVFNGHPGPLSLILNIWFNVLLYITVPLAPILWVLYANLQVYNEEERLHKLKYPLAAVFTINAAVTILSLDTGWFFSISPENIYQRGPYCWVHIGICFALLCYSTLFTVLNRRRLEKDYYYALLLFALPQVIGSAIQVLYYGTSTNWSGMMVSILIIYLYIQDRNLNTDYLTGVYNRRQLDSYIKKKIRLSTPEKSFSVILTDLNNFKQINDTFGHDVGDKALRKAVKVIKSCLRKEDFIARYGGDEFYIILDNNDLPALEATVNRINQAIQRFNLEKNKPYTLSLCMGYDVYRYEEGLKSEEFLKHIDNLMYENKKEIKNNLT